ncbi:MAG TPA: hypothetical protein VNC50_14555 [Planctomycetia bacterium]|nr:hypothetical protein [Planctomycetia bacterium]
MNDDAEDGRDDETKLIRKLVRTFHLDARERRRLPNGRARKSLVLAAIAEELEAGGWHPAGQRPADDFAGGLIERLADGRCRIHWKSEVSMLRYELDAVGEFASADEAARTWLRAMFPRDIDGVPIDGVA